MTVSFGFHPSGDALSCCIGGHPFKPIRATESWGAYAVDGHPMCFEHVIQIQEHRAANSVTEAGVREALIARDVTRARDAAETAIRRRSSSNAAGWVYYIAIGDLIKIGYASDLESRIRSYPPNAELLAVHPGTKSLEADMHGRFAGSRARGREWFRPSSPLTAHIADVRERFGDPVGLVKPMRHAGVKNAGSFASAVLR